MTLAVRLARFALAPNNADDHQYAAHAASRAEVQRIIARITLESFRIRRSRTGRDSVRGFCAEGAAAAPQMLLIRQSFHSRQLLPFQEFEACSATGGDVRDLVGNAGLVDR